jgi:hypothetical protein
MVLHRPVELARVNRALRLEFAGTQQMITSHAETQALVELPILYRAVWADYSYRNATMGSTRLARFAGR